jgi:hypothetical protein
LKYKNEMLYLKTNQNTSLFLTLNDTNKETTIYLPVIEKRYCILLDDLPLELIIEENILKLHSKQKVFTINKHDKKIFGRKDFDNLNFISKKHFSITYEEKFIILTDEKSLNGTIIYLKNNLKIFFKLDIKFYLLSENSNSLKFEVQCNDTVKKVSSFEKKKESMNNFFKNE